MFVEEGLLIAQVEIPVEVREERLNFLQIHVFAKQGFQRKSLNRKAVLSVQCVFKRGR